jgi:hypothetical protein
VHEASVPTVADPCDTVPVIAKEDVRGADADAPAGDMADMREALSGAASPALLEPSRALSPADGATVRVAGEDDETDDNPLPEIPNIGIDIDSRVTIGDMKNGFLRYYGRCVC